MAMVLSGGTGTSTGGAGGGGSGFGGVTHFPSMQFPPCVAHRNELQGSAAKVLVENNNANKQIMNFIPLLLPLAQLRSPLPRYPANVPYPVRLR